MRLMFCLCLMFLIIGSYGISVASNDGGSGIIIVDENGRADYQSIQDAIDAADDFDTILVRSGFYAEPIIIDKPLLLKGDGEEQVIIDGAGRSDVITVLSEEVTLSNLTIQNSSASIANGWSRAGIRILASDAIVKDCIIRDNLLGVFAKQVEYLAIENNSFVNDSLTLYPYDAFDSYRPALKQSHFVHKIKNNTINGKPLVYLLDESDCLLSSEIGQLIAVNCSCISLKNTTISSADFPVLLVCCHSCVIENVRFLDNDAECTLLDSDDNMICSNLFQGNIHGLLLDYGSKSNMIRDNSFIENRFCGCVCEYYSNENSIIRNNFIDNRLAQAFMIRSFRNEWNNNFWSDWIGLEYEVFRGLPKLITGSLFDNYQQVPSILNVDCNPKEKPIMMT